jgi:hypothetical protein
MTSVRSSTLTLRGRTVKEVAREIGVSEGNDLPVDLPRAPPENAWILQLRDPSTGEMPQEKDVVERPECKIPDEV